MQKILKIVEHKSILREKELIEAEQEEAHEERNVAEKDTFFTTGDTQAEPKTKKLVLRDGQVKKEPKPDRNNWTQSKKFDNSKQSKTFGEKVWKEPKTFN